MTSPVFVRTRHIYDSYRDFWKLVEVSGFDTCYVDQMNIQDPHACYITTYINDEWRHTRGEAHVIHWNMEWFTDTEHHAFQDGVTERWTSDKSHADAQGIPYVPVGSDYRLCEGGYTSLQPQYDVALLACMSERRVNIYHELERYHVQIAPNYHAHEGRHAVLMQTRMILHIHQTVRKVISPLRMAVAAAYGIPVLCEECDDPGIYTDACPFAPYDLLVQETLAGLTRRDRAFFIQCLQTQLCETHTFRQCVETALKN